jgi:hypothetical protein
MLDLKRQPAKGAYLIFEALSTLFVRMPLWVLLSVLPATRPRAGWTIGRCIRIRMVSLFVKVNWR